MKETILSVGIDIGTSTTQVVFSRITISNMASDFSVPRVEIIDREIAYRGDIHFTPLKSPVEIDMEKVRDIVSAEYRRAGVDKRDLKTGAVVITGETARKENASEVIRYLSDFAGDFVVATAGPDLESVIAARGAGVDKYSKENMITAANYDIGGGTSNFALFKNGELMRTSCLDIGGRLIRVDAASGTISYIAPKIQKLIEFEDIGLYTGGSIDTEKINRVVGAMVRLLEMSVGLREKNGFYEHILTLPGHDIVLEAPIGAISFSGGVADAIYGGREADVFKYGDVGILLGRAVAASERLGDLRLIQPVETIRATVAGAGSHMTEISGSTIEYAEGVLPVKNLPILKLSTRDEADAATMTTGIREKMKWFEREGGLENAAVSLAGTRSPSFTRVAELARGVVSGMERVLKNNLPLVVIVEHDMAKALGQSIRAIVGEGYPLVCVDCVTVNNGDYVDIGKPVGETAVLPVIVKTLVFR